MPSFSLNVFRGRESVVTKNAVSPCRLAAVVDRSRVSGAQYSPAPDCGFSDRTNRW